MSIMRPGAAWDDTAEIPKCMQAHDRLILHASFIIKPIHAGRVALGRPVDRHDVACIDSHLGASLGRLRTAHAAHSGPGPMLVDGVPLDDLCLTFVLPGRLLGD